MDSLGLGNSFCCNIECNYCELQTKGWRRRALLLSPISCLRPFEDCWRKVFSTGRRQWIGVAGTAKTYQRIKARDYFERVWRNLDSWKALGAKVSVKYIMKEVSAGPDLQSDAGHYGRRR